MSEPRGITKKPRADGQISGLAGEFFVAAELLKRDIQTSVTFGNAKAIDLFAYNSRTGINFNVQVKTLRSNNYFLVEPSKVVRAHIYVFVLLNKPDQPVRYFVVPGYTLLDERARFGKGFQVGNMPGILPKDLADFEGNWKLFEME
jgi:hypothetical protein